MKFYDATIKIRIDKETLEELKKLARKKKIKVSTLVRLLIYAELKKHRTSIQRD
jgi:post-segregation antitoxin (ccd killing protein)